MMSETGVNITRPSRAAAPTSQPRPSLSILAIFLWGGWGLQAAWAQPQLPKPGDAADLVEFGRVKGWLDSGQEHAYAKTSGAPWRAAAEKNLPGTSNLGVEWDEPREFSEVRVAFQSPVPRESVSLEYWVSSWPPNEGRGGWTETDTAWRGEWKPIGATARSENGALLFRFKPLTADENPNAKRRPGYEPQFRRALKMRLRVKAPEPPVITELRVMGNSRRNEREVRIETGCEGKPKANASFEIYNGRIWEPAAG